jgi:hypothetical protein
MDNMHNPSTEAPRRFPGRLLLLLGLGLLVLGVAIYAGQIAARHLSTPWYLPATGTLAVICIAIALSRTRTKWRWAALVLVGLLAAAEWAMLVGARLPAYAGPVAVGKPFPVFTTVQADGGKFTQRDLEGDRDNVLVFFRGRW